MGDLSDIVETTKSELQSFIKNDKNQMAVAAGTLAFLVSKDNKERNAAIAGILAYLLLPDLDKSAGKASK